jgi:hypothetical protein
MGDSVIKKMSSSLRLTRESLRLLDPIDLKTADGGYLTTTTTQHCTVKPCNTSPTCICG